MVLVDIIFSTCLSLLKCSFIFPFCYIVILVSVTVSLLLASVCLAARYSVTL